MSKEKILTETLEDIRHLNTQLSECRRERDRISSLNNISPDPAHTENLGLLIRMIEHTKVLINKKNLILTVIASGESFLN